MKKHGSKREKKVVSVAQMTSSTLYLMVGDKDRVLHRKNGEKLEKLIGGQWVELKVTKEFLMNNKFREY